MRYYLNIFAERLASSAGFFIGTALALGVILFIVMFSFVLWSGLTFGQRCNEMGFETNTTTWNECVRTLATGKAIPRLKGVVPNGELPTTSE
jgi:hypothetical protein